MSRRLTSGLCAIVLGALVVAGCGGDDSDGGPVTLTWFIALQPGGGPQTIADRCSEESNGRYEIELELLPTDADTQREQLVRRLGAEDDSIDIVGMDVIWTGEFANAGWILEMPSATEQVVTKNVFDSVLETAQFEDTFYAAPLWSNTQLLWYRKDRVDKPPKTWDEMIDAAEEIGPEEGIIQVQGNLYEGLTVWANALIGSAGTEILSGPEEIVLEQEPTERALEVMGRLSTSPVAAPDITTSEEDSGRLAFQEGTSSFQINYPFVLPSAEAEAPDVAKQMEAAPFPRIDPNQESAPPLGGFNLAVSAFSDYPEESFEAIECLVSSENQLEIAAAEGLPPVRQDLYDQKAIDKIYPGYAELIRTSIENGFPRPSEAPAYQDLSLGVQRALHPTTDIDPEDPGLTYDELLERVEQAVAREGLL